MIKGHNDVYGSVYQEHAALSPPVRDPQEQDIQIGHLVGTNKRVLDIGCSHGRIAAYIRSLGNEVVGIEIADEYVKQAREKGLQVYQLNIETECLPEGIGIFDTVIMTDILEHLFDPLRVLKEKIPQVLCPGGEIIIAVPNCAYLRDRWELLMGRMPEFGENWAMAPLRPYHITHKSHFVRVTLLEMIASAGFCIRGCWPVEGHEPPRALAMLGIRGKLWRWARAKWVTLLAREFICKAALPVAEEEPIRFTRAG